MTDVLDLAERLWNGEVTVETHHPVGGGVGGVVEVADGVAFWHGFSNSTIARTDAGLVMVPVGGVPFGVNVVLTRATFDRLGATLALLDSA